MTWTTSGRMERKIIDHLLYPGALAWLEGEGADSVGTEVNTTDEDGAGVGASELGAGAV